MLKFTLKFKEVLDCQFPLEISSKKVGCEGWTQARLESVTSSRTISVTHTHTGLGANDALNLRHKQTPIQEKITKWKNIEKQGKLPIIYYLLVLCYNSLLMFKIILCKSCILISHLRNLRHIVLNMLKDMYLASSRTRILTQTPDTFIIGMLLKISLQKRAYILFLGLKTFHTTLK